MRQIQPIEFLKGTNKTQCAGDSYALLAGPCSVESPGQIRSVAEALKADGRVAALRAGIWKPRTQPGSFEGIGGKGLPWLMEASRAVGIPAAVEVATPAHVKAALDVGVDILWIGARTSVNPFAVQEIAETIAAIRPETPVLVKNPVNPDLELWIGAFQRFLQAGVQRLGAIHRGFSSYNSAPYRNSPMWQIPIELHRRLPALPIFHDPSHTGGNRELLQSLSQQALDLGFSGLMIETHPSPEKALSDGGQQITPAELTGLLDSLVIKTDRSMDAEIPLEILRRGIDECDGQILEAIGRRMEYAREIGALKYANNMRVIQPERYERLLSSLVARGGELGLEKSFVEKFLGLLHEESVRLQLDLASQKKEHF